MKTSRCSAELETGASRAAVKAPPGDTHSLNRTGETKQWETKSEAQESRNLSTKRCSVPIQCDLIAKWNKGGSKPVPFSARLSFGETLIACVASFTNTEHVSRMWRERAQAVVSSSRCTRYFQIQLAWSFFLLRLNGMNELISLTSAVSHQNARNSHL